MSIEFWHNENNKKKRCKTFTRHSHQLDVKNIIEPSWSVKVLRCECPHTQACKHMQKHTFHTIKTIGAPVAHPLRKPPFRIVHGTSWHNENNKKKRCKTLTIHSRQLAVKNRIEPSWSVKVLRCECPHTQACKHMQKHTFHTIKTIGAPVAHPLRKPPFRIVHGTSWHNENNKKKRCKTLTIHSRQLAVKNRIEPSWSVKVLRCECPHTHKHANTCKNIHSCYLATSSSILADLLQRVEEP